MVDISVKKIIQTALVSALTFTVALIWKETILEAIALFVPAEAELFYKFIVAVIATIIVVLSIVLILKTEEETEYLIRKYQGKYFLQKVEKEDKKTKKSKD
jgi:hypothetical protein